MKKGFTLVELLIVLAVIAALMAVATPVALNAVATAKANQVAQNLANLKSAVQTAYAVKGLPADDGAAASKTYLAGYISTFPDGYEVYIDFGAKNPAAATITYLLSDPTVDAIKKQNPEVQEKLGSAIKGYPSSATKPDNSIKYAIIEVPIMSY